MALAAHRPTARAPPPHAAAAAPPPRLGPPLPCSGARSRERSIASSRALLGAFCVRCTSWRGFLMRGSRTDINRRRPHHAPPPLHTTADKAP